MTMNSAPIKNEGEYNQVLKEIEELMDAAPNTTCGDRLDLLATLVVAWEEMHNPIEVAPNVSAIPGS